MKRGQLTPIENADQVSVPTFVSIQSGDALSQFDYGTPQISLSDSVEIPTLVIGETPEESLDVASAASQTIETESGAVWVQGNAVLCGCPDCQAPMSVRLWLMVADCWKCDTSIELTPEQQRAARRLLEMQRAANEQISASAPALPTVAPQLPAERDEPQLFPELATAPSQETVQEEFVDDERFTARLIRQIFNSMPAWLVSFLLHLIALLILAMILLPQLSENPTITISSFLSPKDTEGGEVRIQNPTFELQDDISLAQQMTEGDEEVRDVIQKAEQDANELREDPKPTAPLPDLDQVKKNITTKAGPNYSFAARDPRIRQEIVKQEGGTTLTEAAVSRGLRWLASVQNADGSWSYRDYRYNSKTRKRRSNEGDMAATSLALLPFLGAGQTPESGRYKETVARGLKWILEQQKDNGDLRAKDMREEAGQSYHYDMYAHGQATIVLVETFALTGDERFREPCQRAIRFIENAQYRDGGWRYVTKRELRSRAQSGDTSVFGWQLMALQSARSSNLGIKIDDSTFDLAEQYLDLAGKKYRSRPWRDYAVGSLYRYQTDDTRPKHTMTAEALLCRFYLGWDRDKPAVRDAVKYLLKNYPPSKKNADVYYWYYATQAMHHYGGDEWESWNLKLRDLLVLMQNRRGRYPGSWEPDDFPWGAQGGRIFVTSLAICSLEVYYRHLPLFKKLKFEE